MKNLFTTFCLFFLASFNLEAQDIPTIRVGFAKPVDWTITFKKVSANEVDLVATARIEKGWYVYSQLLESDLGPIATSIVLEGGADIETISNVEHCSVPTYRSNEVDEIFKMKLAKFKHDFTITQRLKVKDPNQLVVGYLEYMSCDATKCMPPRSIDFQFSFLETR